MKLEKSCRHCGTVLFEYSLEYSRENPRGLALWEEESRDAHHQASPACLAAYREESEKAWEEYKQNAKILKTIEAFCQSHSYSNGWESPVPYKATKTEEENYETPEQYAREWIDSTPPFPRSIVLQEEIDDGGTHDVSTVRYFKAETSIGRLHIFSYNNNAWGHCDVLDDSDGIQSIQDWLSAWEELPELWLEEYI